MVLSHGLIHSGFMVLLQCIIHSFRVVRSLVIIHYFGMVLSFLLIKMDILFYGHDQHEQKRRVLALAFRNGVDTMLHANDLKIF